MGHDDDHMISHYHQSIKEEILERSSLFATQVYFFLILDIIENTDDQASRHTKNTLYI